MLIAASLDASGASTYDHIVVGEPSPLEGELSQLEGKLSQVEGELSRVEG